MVLFWAPGAILMLFALQVTNVSWLDLFLPGSLLSLIGIVTAYLFEHVTRLNKPIMAAVTDRKIAPETAARAFKQSVHIILVILGLFVVHLSTIRSVYYDQQYFKRKDKS